MEAIGNMFQFYLSSIKRHVPTLGRLGKIKFQFYLSSIKRCCNVFAMPILTNVSILP